MELDYESMIESGVHFGHQTKRWNPKFGPYLYRNIHGVSIIDLERTQECLEKAAAFLTERIKDGANVLLVGTKLQAQELIRELGQAVGMPFCANRWLGGCLTNFETVKASLAKYQRFLTMEETGELNKLPKKEGSVIRREMVRMHRGFEGIRTLEKRPDILFVVDATHEAIAIREARRLQIPVIGVVDTNSDPTVLDFPIPANDDSVKALRIIFEYLRQAIEQGLELRKLNRANNKDISTEVASAAKAKSRKPRAEKASEVKKSVNSGARLEAKKAADVAKVEEKPADVKVEEVEEKPSEVTEEK